MLEQQDGEEQGSKTASVSAALPKQNLDKQGFKQMTASTMRRAYQLACATCNGLGQRLRVRWACACLCCEDTPRVFTDLFLLHCKVTVLTAGSSNPLPWRAHLWRHDVFMSYRAHSTRRFQVRDQIAVRSSREQGGRQTFTTQQNRNKLYEGRKSKECRTSNGLRPAAGSGGFDTLSDAHFVVWGASQGTCQPFYRSRFVEVDVADHEIHGCYSYWIVTSLLFLSEKIVASNQGVMVRVRDLSNG